MSLTSQDLETLRATFASNQHEFLNGNAYITEAAITDRIEQLDPSWEFRIQEIETRSNAGEGGSDVATVTVHASLTIKGVTRDGVGMAVVQRKKDGKSEANEAEKAAATDALKRASRLFSIGRYLLSLPDWVKSVDDMAKYLREPQQNKPANQQGKPANVSNMPQEKATGEIKAVDVKLNSKTQKIYIVAGGVNFYSRQVFRELGYEDSILEKMGNVGTVYIDPVQIVYVEADGRKNPLRVLRMSTGQIVTMADLERKKASGE